MNELKDKLRKKGIKIRSEISKQKRKDFELKIISLFLDSEFFIAPNSFFCYQSKKSEFPTSNLIRELTKNNREVYVPKVISDTEMTLSHVGNSKLASCNQEPDVAIIPALAVSKFGDRIGYGKGYYDRWLARHPKCARVALVFHAQIQETVPNESYDIKVDFLLTEFGIINCKTHRTK